jgi:hypothetical protein
LVFADVAFYRVSSLSLLLCTSLRLLIQAKALGCYPPRIRSWLSSARCPSLRLVKPKHRLPVEGGTDPGICSPRSRSRCKLLLCGAVRGCGCFITVLSLLSETSYCSWRWRSFRLAASWSRFNLSNLKVCEVRNLHAVANPNYTAATAHCGDLACSFEPELAEE